MAVIDPIVFPELDLSPSAIDIVKENELGIDVKDEDKVSLTSVSFCVFNCRVILCSNYTLLLEIVAGNKSRKLFVEDFPAIINF